MPIAGFPAAEDYHRQHLAKNPAGYCGLDGTGASCSGRGTAFFTMLRKFGTHDVL